MTRQCYLDWAAGELRVPIAADLILHERKDPQAALFDGGRLAAVMTETADRFRIPFALLPMDLSLEKEILLSAMGIPEALRGAYKFERPPAENARGRLRETIDVLNHGRARANCEALSRIAAGGRLFPVGISIGPFSLFTRLVGDPITPVYLAGSGAPDGSGEVTMANRLVELAEETVLACCRVQCRAGARAIMVCEPAVNTVFFSPNQIRRKGSRLLADYVIGPAGRIRRMLDEWDCDLWIHDCGELVPEIASGFAELSPELFSFGSPVKLWEMEPFVDKSTVIFGNLPTKTFYSDDEMPVGKVERLTREIRGKMQATRHPFIIGSECDILSMPGCERTIMSKVEAFVRCTC
jgi:uroporphyrinogen-III decarboxylase